MPRIVGERPANHKARSVADEWGIGCMQDHIKFTLADNKEYLCDAEKKMAEAILECNRSLWPAIVLFPSRLSPDLIYAQCTFPYRPYDDVNYKEASGINNFLNKGSIVAFMREHNVASVLAGTRALATALYALDEPRIEECLFVVMENGVKAVPYKDLMQKESSSPRLFRTFIKRIFGKA